jgi:radical SAM superfamily enzyme YgiQ (UPF0313 family)
VVEGSFIMGLDVDQQGIGQQIAAAARRYGLDSLNVLLLTPLPGTRLWEKMASEGRIVANAFPEDWKYYTLRFPVARYKHLSWTELLREREGCAQVFYSYPRILCRVFSALWRTHNPLTALIVLVLNLSCKSNYRNWGLDHEIHRRLDLSRGEAQVPLHGPCADGPSDPATRRIGGQENAQGDE